MKKKFVLGTAQFGSDYGITNLTGKIRNKEIIKIFNYAKKKDSIILIPHKITNTQKRF